MAINRGYNIIIKIFFFILYSYKLEFYLDITIDIKEKKVLNVIK